MADPILDELNLTTLKEIYPEKIEDNFFLDTPFEAYLRDHCLVPFKGGAFMQAVFRYAPMLGGAYAQGDTFNIQKQQTLSGVVFDPKKYEVSVPEYLEDLEITNKGPLAVFSLVDADLENAMDTISSIMAIDLSLHGQTSATGIVGNRPKNMNGWIEIINDGITPGWEGSVFTSYGTQPRNGVIGKALNGNVIWGGNQDGTTSAITYQLLEESYQTCSVGRQEPDLGVSNKANYAYIKERIQPQQRFAQEKDPIWGVTGMKMNSAMILKDDYFPSLKYGQNDPFIGNWLTSTFTSPGTVGSGSNMPTTTTINVGEVFCWFNTRKFYFRVSDSPLFGFGWTGFKPAQDSTRVVGQVLASANLESNGCRYHAQLLGFGG